MKPKDPLPAEESAGRSALVIYPALAEALDELIDEYGLDLVMDAIEEIAEENECD